MKGIKKPAIILSLIFFLAFFLAADNSTAQEGGADAIAVRIMPNPNHYSISRWYASQGFAGSPQALVVDGYEAIRDGRTVYVNAANIDPATRNIYTNIYLISYNQDSAPKTVDILGQIIAHWKFNDNVVESVNPAPSCSISSLNCATDAECGSGQACALAGPTAGSCVLKESKNCATDSDCPTNFFCNSLKSKITRDIKRVGRLEELREALYNFKQTNKRYPSLSAGTYVPNNSLSVWPSWNQVLLSGLAVSQNFVDPINKIGKCLMDTAVKNGTDYSATVNGCSINSGLAAGSCSNASWEYSFNVNGGAQRLWIETSNANNGGVYGDLSAFAPEVGTEDACPEDGVQHHLSVYVDGVLKGAACNPAVNPDQPRQTAYVDLGNLTGGVHTIRVQWDNDWSFSPDGIWGTADDADSNIRVYRLGLTSDSSFDLKTCWDQNSKQFAYSSVPGYGSSGTTLTLPAASYVFAYSSDANGSQYNLCASLEGREAPLDYHFYPADLANSACVSAAGVSLSGQAGNTAPRIISESLNGEANQPFSGFIQVIDAEGNPLKWTINNITSAGWSTWQNGGSPARPPVLLDTSNPNQKKIYADAAGAPGSYDLSLTIEDGLGGTLVTTTRITIFSSVISLSADNVEYGLNTSVPFNYSLSFISNNLTTPASAYSVTKLSGPAGVDPLAGLTKTFSNLGDGEYQVKYNGVISSSYQFTKDEIFRYRLSVTDKYNKTVTKDFIVTLKPENPALGFTCADSARAGQVYNCVLGSMVQNGHDITYTVTGLPAGLHLYNPLAIKPRENSVPGFWSKLLGRLFSPADAAGGSDYIITGSPQLSAVGNHTVTITATNEYGAKAVKSFVMKVNSFCGDNTKQNPNTEGRGGLYNDGQEDCDGSAGVTTDPAASKINLQYGCTSGANTPNPILSNDLCVYKSPLKGGGYCGDGYCQLKIDGQVRESCWKCATDCGECGASVISVTKEESVVYLNGQRQYQAVWPNQGSVTKNLLSGKNVFAFWSHVTNGAAGLAYKIVIGPEDEPYDILDTTNSRLNCAADPSPATWLSSNGFNPSSLPADGNGYKWYENAFTESGAFSVAKVLVPAANAGLVSPLAQKNIAGKTVNDAFLPYAWGTSPTSAPSAFYCRLSYNYSLANLGVCRPRCADRDCGTDGCGGACGNRTDNSACAAATKVCSPASNNQCCVPQCNGKCAGEADGCGGTCADTGSNNVCASSSEVKSCNLALGVTAGFVGNSPSNSHCSGYDTSLAHCQIDAAQWFKAPNDEATEAGRSCLIKLNIDSNYIAQCEDFPVSPPSLSDKSPSDPANTKSQWFKGIIQIGGYKTCSIPGVCTEEVNPTKCRYGTTYNQAYCTVGSAGYNPATCAKYCPGPVCNLGMWTEQCYVRCERQCTGKQCGDDGCGGQCGTCNVGQVCNPSQTCVAPACSNNSECNDSNPCTDDTCTNPGAHNAACTRVNNSATGSCSSSFGTCNISGVKTCSGGVFGACVAKDPRPATCAGKCGGIQSDGCGGTCSGTCGAGQTCNASGQCVGSCVPNCSGKVCGSDGCGGDCGNCSARYRCTGNGTRCEFCGRPGCGETPN